MCVCVCVGVYVCVCVKQSDRRLTKGSFRFRTSEFSMQGMLHVCKVCYARYASSETYTSLAHVIMLSKLQAVNQYGTYSVWANNLEIRHVSQSHALKLFSTTDLLTVLFCLVILKTCK